MSITEDTISRLRVKFPAAYKMMLENPSKEMLRWFIENLESFKSKKPQYIIVKESRLLSVDKVTAKHTYK